MCEIDRWQYWRTCGAVLALEGKGKMACFGMFGMFGISNISTKASENGIEVQGTVRYANVCLPVRSDATVRSIGSKFKLYNYE